MTTVNLFGVIFSLASFQNQTADSSRRQVPSEGIVFLWNFNCNQRYPDSFLFTSPFPTSWILNSKMNIQTLLTKLFLILNITVLMQNLIAPAGLHKYALTGRFWLTIPKGRSVNVYPKGCNLNGMTTLFVLSLSNSISLMIPIYTVNTDTFTLTETMKTDHHRF